MSNVIQFPERPGALVPKNENNLSEDDVEEMEDRLKEIHMNHIDKSSTHISRMIIHKFDSYGYNVMGRDGSLKDLVLITEAIKSAMYRFHGIEHVFQEIADENYTIELEEDEILEGPDDFEIVTRSKTEEDPVDI